MQPRSASPSPHVRVAIVGTGFGGLGTAARLRQAGIDDFVLFERAGEVGGVWRENRYPGAACDVESRLYEFSFAPNPDWSHRFGRQPEIWAYLRRCADDFGLRERILFHHEVLDAAWDEAAQQWHLTTSQGPYTADLLVAAPGSLATPRRPDLPGLDRFAGPAFHSSRWPDGLDLAGTRVAVIGTGASALQIVPAIQGVAEHVTVYQRTPPWVIPRLDRPLGPRTKAALRRFPFLGRLIRGWLYLRHEILGLAFRHPHVARRAEALARFHLRRQVADTELRERLTPDYLLGCKRIILSDDYYPALQKANVALVDGGAAEVRPHGVVGADGVERPADVLVLCTGFHVTDLPFARLIRGRDGQSLADAWTPTMRAHLGTTVHGFPNLFILQGPNTGLGHSSVVLIAEAQIEHIVNALQYMDTHAVAAVEPRAEAQAQFVAEVDDRMQNTVWIAGGCDSWYLDETGRNATLWPRSTGAFRRRVVPFLAEDYHLHREASKPIPEAHA